MIENVITTGVRAVNYDRSTVKAVVQHYFDALYEGDADKLAAIFHPSADLRWLEKGELQILTVPDWMERVRKRASAKSEGKSGRDRCRVARRCRGRNFGELSQGSADRVFNDICKRGREGS